MLYYPLIKVLWIFKTKHLISKNLKIIAAELPIIEDEFKFIDRYFHPTLEYPTIAKQFEHIKNLKGKSVILEYYKFTDLK